MRRLALVMTGALLGAPSCKNEQETAPLTPPPSAALAPAPQPRPDPFGLAPGETLWMLEVYRVGEPSGSAGGQPGTDVSATEGAARKAGAATAGSADEADRAGATASAEGAAKTGVANEAASAGVAAGEPPSSEPAQAAAGAAAQSGTPDRNTVAWTPRPGATAVTLFVVRQGETRGTLRARQGESRQDVISFAIKPGGKPALGLQPRDNGTAVFRYSPEEGASEKNERVVLLLGWDDKDQKVQVKKRWRGAAGQAEPLWLQSGQFTADKRALGKCRQVVQRIAKCAKAPAFSQSLFVRMAPERRPQAEKEFLGQVSAWAKPAGARDQCERWASDEYRDTHLSDTDELNALLRDTNLSCTLFGHEIVDEGGLPEAIATGT